MSIPQIPHDADAEQIILANCLLLESVEPLGDLAEGEFYSQAHQALCRGFRHLQSLSLPINLLEIAKYAMEREQGEKWGAPGLLAGLTDGVPKYANGVLDQYRARIRATAEARSAFRDASQLALDASAGVTVEEIHDRAERLAAKTAPQPRGKKEKRLYPDMPAEALLGAAQLYVQAHTEASEANDNYHLGFFFTAVGMLLGRTAYTMKSRIVYPNLYTVLVGKSGARKGTAQNFALDFLRSIDSRVHITESIDSRQGFIQDAADGQKLLNDQGYEDELRMALSLEEFRSFVETSEQKGTKGVVPELCLWYDCPHERENKSVSHPCKVKQPTLNIFAGTSPSFLENLSIADIQGGIGNRICWVPGDPKPRKDDPPEPDEAILAPLKLRIKDIIEQRRAFGVKRYNLTPEAKKRWKAWYQNEFNPGSADELITILSERDHLTCLKVALIYAVLDLADAIELHHVQAAIAWVTFLYESRFPIFSGHGLTPRAQVERKIVDFVRDGHRAGGLSYRNLQRSMGRIDAETFHRAMKALAPEQGDGPLRIDWLAKKRWVYLND